MEKKNLRFYIGLFFSCLFILWSSKILPEFLAIKLIGEVRGGGVLFSYLSPIVILMAIAILGCCTSLSVPGKRMSKAICSISVTSFSVYIIHEQPMIKHHFIIDRFAQGAEQNAILMIISVFATAVAIFGICTVIDLVRIWLFHALHVKERSEKLCGVIANRVQSIGGKLINKFS